MAVETLEHVQCDLCGACDAEPIFELKDRMFETTLSSFRLVRCRRCNLLYLNPRPTIDQIGHYYQESYAPFSRSGLAGRVKRRTIARDISALWPSLSAPARVIDVGCATGDLLQAVREQGNPNVLGIEPNPHAANLARERWGFDVFTGTLENANLPEQSVDVALMAHTIEHLPSPSTTIDELSQVLKPGGTLVLWLPNADSIAARLLGEWWIGYDAPRHFYAFTLDTLTQLLDQHGFTIHAVSHEWIGLEWSWAVRLIVRERFSRRILDAALALLHPALTLGLTPISLMAALVGHGGRIRVVAAKHNDT